MLKPEVTSLVRRIALGDVRHGAPVRNTKECHSRRRVDSSMAFPVHLRGALAQGLSHPRFSNVHL